MKQLKIYIIIFCVALSIPLTYLVLCTYQALEKEEVAKLQYFAETIFDQMEKELTAVVLKEEGRAVDEYNYKTILPNLVSGAVEAIPSPLSRLPEQEYILGYFQNNPDGSFQTPLVETGKTIPRDRAAVISQLKDTNRIFNQKQLTASGAARAAQTKMPVTQEQEQATGFADKYLVQSESQKPKSYLGRKEKRVEKITIAQALNIAPQDRDRILGTRSKGTESGSKQVLNSFEKDQQDEESLDAKVNKEVLLEHSSEKELHSVPYHKTEKYQVEVTPLRSVFITPDQVFIFRRIKIDNQMYRQGFIIRIKTFLNHLAQAYFVKQPLARYANLTLKTEDQGIETEIIKTGAVTQKVNFLLNRTFPSPFNFLRATLICDQIPQSAGRGTLNIMIAILVVVILMGLFAIYKSAGTVLDLSERRSKFVSSVTHELKTPLTNMRMYIEMLEQGMARDREREQDYFNILGSESARLSRLIDNVLELSKLEKKQRHINLREGVFDDVIQEVTSVMHEKLRQEGFTFIVENTGIKPFKYDPEVMILILINLMENSIKFGKAAPVKKITLTVRHEDDGVNIHVSDTGPGIPRQALKKIFDDFYRVESPLTRTTGGTGIGLALVKKFVTLMGGEVHAENNTGPGCTIMISLPQLR